MFENIINLFKKLGKKEESKGNKDTAKERLHLVLMQDRANVSADFLDMMKQEIIDVIKKYIDVDENEIDVKLTNKQNSDGTTGAPALYANIPIISIKNEARKIDNKFSLNASKNENNKNKEEKSTDGANAEADVKAEEKDAKLEETKNESNKNENSKGNSSNEDTSKKDSVSSNQKEEKENKAENNSQKNGVSNTTNNNVNNGANKPKGNSNNSKKKKKK